MLRVYQNAHEAHVLQTTIHNIHIIIPKHPSTKSTFFQKNRLFLLTFRPFVRYIYRMTTEEYELIARKLRPRLFSIGREFFGDSDTAEDVAQETLMRLWVMRGRVAADTGVEALAVRMARNVCVSEWRRRKVRLAVSDLSTAAAQPDNADTDSIMAERDNTRLLKTAVGRLTPTEQRLYRMRHELDMDISQITAATGIGEHSVSAMLSKARRQLLEMIKRGGCL